MKLYIYIIKKITFLMTFTQDMLTVLRQMTRPLYHQLRLKAFARGRIPNFSYNVQLILTLQFLENIA